LEWLLEAVLAKGLWRRNRVALVEKVDASLAYMAGLSYRDVAYVLEIVRARPRRRLDVGSEAQASSAQG